MKVLVLLSLIIMAAAIILAFQNMAVTSVNFLFWTFQGSLAAILLISFVGGTFTGLLLLLPSVIQGKLTARFKEKQVQAHAKELSEKKRQLEEAHSKLSSQQRSGT